VGEGKIEREKRCDFRRKGESLRQKRREEFSNSRDKKERKKGGILTISEGEEISVSEGGYDSPFHLRGGGEAYFRKGGGVKKKRDHSGRGE